MSSPFHAGSHWRGTADVRRSPELRAERARLKSCKDDEKIAQGKQRHERHPGLRRQNDFLFFPIWFGALGRVKPDWKKERLGGGRDGALRRPRRVQRRKGWNWNVPPLAFLPPAKRGRGHRSAMSLPHGRSLDLDAGTVIVLLAAADIGLDPEHP